MASPIDPSYQFVAVTPSDTAILAYRGPNDAVAQPARCRGIYIGGAGNLAVADDRGNSVTFTSLSTGTIHPISTNKVFSTNTTATSIVALF